MNMIFLTRFLSIYTTRHYSFNHSCYFCKFKFKMGSTGRIKKLQYTRLEMLELNSCSPVENKSADVAQCSVNEEKNLHEEFLGGRVAGDIDLIKACRSCFNSVPTRPRTHRVVVGILTADPEDNVYYFRSTKMIVDEKNLSTRMIVDGENLGMEDGGDNLCSTQLIVDEKNLDVGDNLCSTKMIIDGKNLSAEDGRDNLCDSHLGENNSRKCEKRSRDEDYIVSDDDDREESSKKKRRKNAEKRTMTFRKNQTGLLNYPPSELPQNLQDYISRLNLEAPPFFVAQKALYPSDIRCGQNRLSLPAKIINPDFFDKYVPDTEKEKLKRKEHVKVSLVDNKMHEYHTINLARWDLNSSSNYVLITAWRNVVQDNKLEEAVIQKDGKEETIVVMKEDDKLKSDVVVQVWCFRSEIRMWFAINIQAMSECSVIGKTKDGLDIVA